jgi:hypothetical protein
MFILTTMKKSEDITFLAISILLGTVCVSLWTFGLQDRVAHAQNVTGPTGFPPLEAGTGGNLTTNDTISEPDTSNGNIPPLANLIIEHARGGFTSLQTDADNKTWVTTGDWDLASDPSVANQSNSSSVQFNATIRMKGTDNSAEHEHEVSEFKVTDSSVSSSDEGSTIVYNGTASVETDVGLYSEVPVSIRIIDGAPAIVSIDTQTNEIKPQWVPGGGTLILTIDKRVEDHFGDTPVYGNVRGED